MSDNSTADQTARRKEARQSTDGIAVVRVVEGPFPELKNTKYPADVLDVSASGLRLDCDELLDQCKLLMKVRLRGAEDDVTVRGDVRWASWEEGGKYQLGVEFTDNDAPVVIKWHNILKSIS